MSQKKRWRFFKKMYRGYRDTNKKKTLKMNKGKVKWFDDQKGFGFIEQSDGEDLFVHHSQVQGGYLGEGDEVEFEVGEGRKGPCAVNVKPV